MFPRVNVQNHWQLTAPPGSEFASHAKATGWMTTENFTDFVRHFIKHVKPSQESPVS